MSEPVFEATHGRSIVNAIQPFNAPKCIANRKPDMSISGFHGKGLIASTQNLTLPSRKSGVTSFASHKLRRLDHINPTYVYRVSMSSSPDFVQRFGRCLSTFIQERTDMADTDHLTHTILRRKEVQRRTGLSGSTIYERMKAGAFPKPVSLSPRTVGWIGA